MSSPRPAAFSSAILSLVVVSTFCFAASPDRIIGPITSASTVSLAKSFQAHPWAQNDQGPVDSSFLLTHITLVITPSASQQKGIDRLLVRQQDPRSPNYHKWLTPEQYAQRFGLSPNDIKKICAWLQSEGFTVLTVEPGGNAIVFSGTAAQVEKTFQTQIHRYDAEGEARFSNATPPQIPAALSGIVTGIRGLNNFHLQSRAKRIKPDYYDAHFNHNFMAPGDAATIYDITPLYTAGNDGTGQKLAIIGQTDIYLADIADFRNGFNLSAITGCTVDINNLITACNTANFQYVLTGGTDPHSASPGDLSEADIDIEWSGAIARNAQIIYVNSPDPKGNGVIDSMSYAINHSVAPVVSMSYGLCEFFSASNAAGGFPVFTESEFQQANLQGMTIMTSSGDSGAANCDNPFTAGVLATLGYAVDYPASSPSVTGVGGTSFSYQNLGTGQYWSTTNGSDGGSALSYIPELAWNDDAEFAAFCTANPTNIFCTTNKITNQFTAQSAVGIFSAGGGMSNCFTIDMNGICTGGLPQPSWQTVTVAGLINGQSVPNPAPRFVPDVSLLSSSFPGFITCTAQSEVGGTGSASTCAGGIAGAIDTYNSVFVGTSIASPIFAGVVALLNQYMGNANGMGNANPMLYKVAAIAPSAFHDIATGDNTVYCTQGDPVGQPQPILCPAPVPPDTNSKLGYAAATGYDLATGLGSVDVNNLAIAFKAPLPDFSIGTSNSSLTTYPTGSAQATITVTPINNLSQAITFSCSGAPTGASCSFNPPFVMPPATTSTILNVQTSGSESGTNGFSVVATTGVLSQLTHSVAESLTVAPNQFTFTTSGTTTHTVLAGQSSLVYQFVATPAGGATTFAAAVTFACAFTPADPTLTNASCTFSPPSIAAGTNGVGGVPVTVSVTTAGPNTGTGGQSRQRADNRLHWLPFSLPLAGIIVAGIAGRKLSRYSLVASCCVALALLGVLVACGGSSPAPIMVSGVSGSPSSLYPNNTGWPSQTAKFSAVVSSDNTNRGVTWAVGGSAASNGTIDANGVYTAPTVAAGLPAMVTITATSVADPTKSATAQETLKPATVPGAYTATVTASEAGATDQTAQVTLTVQ